jgi:restriction endonuclease S subunit
MIQWLYLYHFVMVNIAITLPPINEQIEIASRVAKLFSFLDHIEEMYEEARQTSLSIPNANLTRAFAGLL